MKKGYILFGLILIVFQVMSCKMEQRIDYSESTEEKKIIITGEILEFNPDTDDVFIKFGYNNIFDIQNTDEVIIDDNGKFSYVFTNVYPSEYFFVYNRFVNFYAFPGDSLHLIIDKQIVRENDSYGTHFSSVSFSGNYQQMTLDFHEYQKIFLDSMMNIDEEFEAVNKLKSLEYKEYVNKRTQKYKLAIQKYLKLQNASSFFEKWCYYDIEYSAYNDLMRYRWLHASRKDINMDDFKLPHRTEYMSFLSDKILNDKQAIISNKYHSFIRGCSRYYSRDILIEDSLNKLMGFYKGKNLEAAMKMKIRFIVQSFNGYGRDLALCEPYAWLLEIKDFKTYEKLIIDNQIKDEVLLQILDNKYKKLTKHLKNPEYNKDVHLQSISHALVEELLDSISKKHHNKVLYIDFWAPWCSPCMGGIENAKKLKRKYVNSDIVFVYFGVSCERDKWEATISEKKIKGEHYFLSNNQYSYFSKTFNIVGIPHYIIIDKDGKIVDKKAPSPLMEEELDKVFKELLR